MTTPRAESSHRPAAKRLSVCAALIVRDEAHHLEQLLPRLAWADQVVIVDGGSTDATVAIARRHGARVIEHPFDDFASQRNRARLAADCQWILSIDADERPTPHFAACVRTAIALDRAAAFRVPIRSTILGRSFRYSGTQDDRPIRLFCRDSACWVGQVHEALSVRGKVASLDSGLEHVTLPDAWAFLTKMNRYTALAAAARVEQHRPPWRSERYWAPARECFRRLIWKRGLLDGPAGWTFCLLSGLSAWVVAERHARYWRQAQQAHRSLTTHLPRAGSAPGAACVAARDDDAQFANHSWGDAA